MCGTIILEGRRIACVIFSSGQDYLHEAEVSQSFFDGNMIVDESDSNLDISFLVNGGVFNYVIEEIAIDNIFRFELNLKKFTFSKGDSLIVE